MDTGPVQLLIVFGHNHSDFYGDVVAELGRVRTEHAVRLIDALAVYKDVHGQIELRQLRDLDNNQPVQARRGIGAIIGLDGKGTQSDTVATDRTEVFSEQPSWDVFDEIPNDSAAALVLLQHHWAVRLHDAITSVGWFRLSDGFLVSPLDLGVVGLAGAE
jgi:hypothetical protein